MDIGATVPSVVDESEGISKDMLLAKLDVATILEYLRKNNLKNAETALLGENPLPTSAPNAVPKTEPASAAPLKSLETYKSTEAPSTFENDYENFLKFIDGTLEAYKDELRLLKYPAFIHMYLNLVYNNHEHSGMYKLYNNYATIYIYITMKTLCQLCFTMSLWSSKKISTWSTWRNFAPLERELICRRIPS
ncbi:Taf5 [Bugula neritina]|uniref:Taf5 n=1 Tax=Bugula neritina TaxID=10212 RepID=A0A7J7JGE5_BUGNE|nr:Taf5 [Bugula neritina]